MNDVALVRVVQRLADLESQVHHLAPGQRLLVLLELLIEDVLQGQALDELHGEVVGALEAADAQPANDVRVPEVLEDLGLALEPLGGVAAAGLLAGDDLHRRGSAGLGMGRPIDDPHRPGAELGFDQEGPELLAEHVPGHRSIITRLGACGRRGQKEGRRRNRSY